ncbi:MAG: hypothetical protein AB9869_10945 [Verrucomicrobiia bacterium]
MSSKRLRLFPFCGNMRRQRAPLLSLAVAGLAALTSLLLAGCGAEPAIASIPKAGNTAAKTVASLANQASELTRTNVDLPAIRSVFHSGPEAGRNPFYPNLSRTKAATDLDQPVMLPAVSYLRLVGLRSGTTRPLALINRTSLAPGDEAAVPILVTNALNKVEVQKISVRCVAIRRNSVLISIAGEEGVKELHLAHER